MKELKKETKIIVGVSITLVLLAIIATVVVLAVKSAKRGTQLLSHEYVWVENKNGKVTMRDGLFVAAVDGGYVLAKEDKILSKKYADLRLVDEEKKIYEFASFDGTYGRLDSDGKEIADSVTKANGNFIGDTAQFTDFGFCTYYDGGMAYAKLGNAKSGDALESKRYAKIYKHGETEAVLSQVGGTGNYENVLRSGAFFALRSDKYYIASVYGDGVEIELSGVSVDRLCYGFITLSGAEGLKTYSLPRLEHIPELDGISGENISEKNGWLFYYDDGRVKIVGDEGFPVSFKPDRVVGREKVEGKDWRYRTLLTGEGKGVYNDGSYINEGYFQDFGVLYRVGSKLIYAETLEASAVENEYVTKIETDGKIFFFIGEANAGMRALYEFKNGGLEFKSDAAYTTYGDPLFEDKRYKGEYETYFMYGGKTYDADFSLVGDGVIVRRNLLKNGNDYTDIKGNNKIENVSLVSDVYDYEGNAIDEYLFVRGNEYFLSNDPKTPIGFDSGFRRVVKAENGVYVFVVEGGLKCAGDEETLYVDNCKEYVLMSNSNIALISDSQVRIVKPTKRGFEEVASYGFFGVSLDVNYKLMNNEKYGVVFGKTCQRGVVFRDANGNAGFIDSDGRLALSPVYDEIALTEHYAIVKNGGRTSEYSRYAVADLHGRMITGFEYEKVMPLGSFVMGLKADGSAEIVNARGNNVAKDVVFGDYLLVENYVTQSGRYVLDSKIEYIFVNVNGKYRLVRIYA